MSIEYSFPSFLALEKVTPSPTLTFHVELKGALLLARRTFSLPVINALLGTGRLVNGGVPGLPNISGHERAALYYLKKLLERSLKVGPKGPSPYGDIIVTEYSERNYLKQDAWQIRYDPDVANNNNVSYTVDSSFWTCFGLEEGEDPPPYAMISIAIISPELRWDQQCEWQRMLEQLQYDLLHVDKNVYFETSGTYSRCRKPNLSVNFGIEGQQEINIDILQQTLTLYGLHETVVDSWVQNIARPAGVQLPRRIRLGIEKMGVDKPASLSTGLFRKFTSLNKDKRQQLTPNSRGFIITDDLAHFYTHEEFANVIYERLQWAALKTKISGYPAETSYSDGSFRPYGPVLRDGTTVNISEPDKWREKQMTIEFKHHFATNDIGSIIWWIKFCGYFFRYAAYLGKLRVKIEEHTFVKEILSRDLLELIGFPKDGKTHFEDLAKGNSSPSTVAAAYSSLYKRKLDLDEILIKKREVRRRKYFVAANAAGEIKNLESMLDIYPESDLKKALLPGDLPFVTEEEWPKFITYLRTAETNMRHHRVLFQSQPAVRDEDTDEIKAKREREYLATTVVNAWIDFTGHPRLRRARMERGFVPEMYAHTDEMPVDWSKRWLRTGIRPKSDQTLDDGSVIVGAQSMENMATQEQQGKDKRVSTPSPKVLEDEPTDILDYESDDSLPPVVVPRPVKVAMMAAATEVYDDDNNPYPGETWFEHDERVKDEKKKI